MIVAAVAEPDHVSLFGLCHVWFILRLRDDYWEDFDFCPQKKKRSGSVRVFIACWVCSLFFPWVVFGLTYHRVKIPRFRCGLAGTVLVRYCMLAAFASADTVLALSAFDTFHLLPILSVLQHVMDRYSSNY